jgi:transposase-like protein
MLYSPKTKLKARQLRKNGRLPLAEIARQLEVPKGTLWYWLRDIPLTQEELKRQRVELASRGGQQRATEAMQRKYEKLRAEAYQQGLQEMHALSQHDTFAQFITLYIAEGYKRSRHTVSICNTDPRIMRFSWKWLQYLSKPDSTFRFNLRYYPDHNKDELGGYWANYLGNVSPKDIHATLKSTNRDPGYRRSEHGLFSIESFDTLFRARLQAWIDSVHLSWETDNLIPLQAIEQGDSLQ